MRFTKKIFALVVVATSALYLTACGTRSGADTEPADVHINWTKLDDGLYRGCDTKTGNLIYVYWSNGVSVVENGCKDNNGY